MRNTIRAVVPVAAMLAIASGASAQTDSPNLAPANSRESGSDIVTFGTARFGLPRAISIVPSALKAKAGLITTLPSRNNRLGEGDVMLSASGRPVFVLQGESPAYRDLVPGIAGQDIRQLEQALARLGFDPGSVDGRYDDRTGAAVAKWYISAGWKPFGPTVAQRTNIRTLEAGLAGALKARLAAAGAATAAALAVKSARAAAEHAKNTAAADIAAQTAARDKAIADLANATLAVEAARATADHLYKVASADRSAKVADRKRLKAASGRGTPLAVAAASAKSEHANKAARADIAAKVAARALVMLDPRSSKSARAVADAQLQLARAAASHIRLEGELAVQAAERDVKLMAERFELAQAAVTAAELEGGVAVQAALNARKAAERDVKLAQRRLKLAQAAATVKQLDGRAAVQAASDALKVAELDLELASDQATWAASDLEAAKRRTGVQVPADEIVFVPALPVRVEQATVLVGDPASGPVLAVTQDQLAIDSSLPVDAARLVKRGMKVGIVAIDNQAPGTKATGFVEMVAGHPGTNGVDGQHVYFRVRIDGTATALDGVPLRLTIPVGSTEGESSAPPSKHSLAPPSRDRASGSNTDIARSRPRGS